MLSNAGGYNYPPGKAANKDSRMTRLDLYIPFAVLGMFVVSLVALLVVINRRLKVSHRCCPLRR